MKNIEIEINELISNLTSPRLFWIRTDDVGIYSEKFNTLCDLFSKYNLPVLFAVIPSKLERQTIDKLKTLNNYVISQHGYSHKNFSKEYQCELSDNRNLDDVLSEMKLGKKLLKEVFQDDFYSVLTPPFNKIDPKCTNILKNEFDCVSIFANSTTSFRKDFNPNIDIINWHINSFENKEFVLNQIKKSLINFTHIGMCIHCEYLDDESFKILDEIFSYLTSNSMITIDFDTFKRHLIV